jgi:prepilin-type N-terminal cleavage/methylation domain-containing protein
MSKPLHTTKLSSGTRGELGFTLVEIAIVLVIVGLLIGGVLKGQEMITNARIKRIESDNASIAVALHSYKDRYGELPGDDPGAEARFDEYTPGSGFDGDGDTRIGGVGAPAVWNMPPDNTPVENNGMWAHLRASGLVSGGATDRRQPSNAYGGMIGVQAQAFPTAASSWFRHAVVFGRVPGSVARILEARLDDGSRDAGDVRSRESPAPGTFGVLMVSPPNASYQDETLYDIGFRW